MSETHHEDVWRVQFVLLAAVWGSSFLCIKVLGERWPPLWVTLGRVTLGTLTLLTIARARREHLHFHRRTWLHLLVVATISNAIPFTLYAYGEQHVSSVVAGLWNATTPLWVLTAAVFVFGEERLNRDRVLGLLTGFAGVVLVLGPWHGLGHGAVLGHLACAGAAVCYGIAWPYTRRHIIPRADSAIALAAAQLLLATAILSIAAPLTEGIPTAHIGLDGASSLFALGVLATGVAYALNYAVIRAAGSAVASTVTYLVPVFSTLLGVIVLGEALRWNEPVGAVVLIVGIAITQGRIHLRRRRWRIRIAAPIASPKKNAPR